MAESLAAFDDALAALVTDSSAPATLAAAAEAFAANARARALMEEFEGTGDPVALEGSVDGYQLAASLIPGGSRFEAGSLSDVLHALMLLQRVRQSMGLIDDAIAVGRRGVSLDDMGRAPTAVAAQLRHDLSSALCLRAEVTGDVLAAGEALRVGRRALEIYGKTPNGAATAVLLARAALLRFGRQPDRADLTFAIGLLRDVLTDDELPPATTGWALLLVGDALTAGHDTGSLGPGFYDPLGTASSSYRRAAGLLEDPILASRARILGASARARAAVEPYRLNERPASGHWMVKHKDVDELAAAIDELRECAIEVPLANRMVAYNQLSGALRDRGMLLGGSDDAHAARQAQAQAAVAATPGSADQARMLSNLGRQTWEVWRNHDHLGETLAEAVDAWERADAIVATRFMDSPVAAKLADADTWQAMRTRLSASAATMAELETDGRWSERFVEYAEGTKSALLRSLVAFAEIPAPTGVTDVELNEERTLLDALIELDRVELGSHGAYQASRPDDARSDIATRLRRLWLRWEELGPEAHSYVSLRRADRLTWEHFVALLTSGRALVCLSYGPDRVNGAVIRDGWNEPRLVSMPLPPAELADLMATYRLEVDPLGVELGAETWHERLKPFLATVAEHLQGATEVIVSPHGQLHLLPWPALLRITAPEPLAGIAPVVVEPAFSVLAALQARPPAEAAGSAVFGDPLGDLKFAATEAKQIATVLNTTPHLGKAATREAVLEALRSNEVVHIAAHGEMSPGEPLLANLRLADGPLTARDILRERVRARLVVLSACDSGRGAFGGGDELLGLTHSLLQAGVSSLVVSLWPVDDAVTSTLMTEFHSYCAAQACPAEALRRASERVRSQYEHTWFWGAFTTVGLGL